MSNTTDKVIEEENKIIMQYTYRFGNLSHEYTIKHSHDDLMSFYKDGEFTGKISIAHLFRTIENYS